MLETKDKELANKDAALEAKIKELEDKIAALENATDEPEIEKPETDAPTGKSD